MLPYEQKKIFLIFNTDMQILFSDFKINKTTKLAQKQTNFCGINKTCTDVFEKSGELVKLSIYNPFTLRRLDSKQLINFNQPSKIIMKDPLNKKYPLIVDYDPNRTGFLKNRKTDQPIEVNILKSESRSHINQTAYHFMSKNLKEEYGYVELCLPIPDKNSSNELLKDYPEYGIVGKRAVVSYLQNWDEENIKGVGILADKLGVKYCLENGFEPNIVSYADAFSHVSHFKRGKRFIPPAEGSEDYKFLKSQYGKTDPNEILLSEIQNANWNGTTVDLTGWGYLMMYLPKDLIEKYRKCF